jgi:MFS family permease
MSFALFPIYVGNLLLSLSFFSVIYINTAYLLQFMTLPMVNVLYLVGAIIGTLIFLAAPSLIEHLGKYLVMTGSTILTLGSFYILSGNHSTPILIAAFLLSQSFVPIIAYGLDLYLEEHLKNETSTGRARSLYLLVTYTIAVLSPFLAGVAINTGGFGNAYYFASAFLALFLIIVLGIFRHLKTKPIKVAAHEFGILLKEPRLATVVAINFALQIFYAAMVLYLPLLLTRTVGFSWDTTGTLLSIMLLPFMLFVLPIGYLVDTKIEEPRLLQFGLLCMGMSTIALYFLPTSGENLFILWAITLFMTRIGAVIVETASESYFFKQVDGKDISLISIFRTLRPLSFVLAPVLGMILLPQSSYRFFFVIIGILLVLLLHLPMLLRRPSNHKIPASHFYKRLFS